MVTGFNSTLEYLRVVRDRFGSERAKYSEFFQIFLDFIKKVDFDEIIQKIKELFNGDERMITEFYTLFLDTKRKKKKPDDFWEALNRVGKNMGYIVLNRPWAFVQWLQKANIQEEYILMAEPDHLIVKPIPNLPKEGLAAAFPFFYIEPKKF